MDFMSKGRFTVTLDRIEDGQAVLLLKDEESVSIFMPVCLLPAGTEPSMAHSPSFSFLFV
jgi:hypothetical protein